MTLPLPKLKRTRLSEQAAGELKRMIATGAYAAGSRLPPEAELAAELGVTRLTVREALSSLEAAGLTSTRHGSGTYVADVESSATLDLFTLLLGAGRRLSSAECLDLMEFRSIVISGFADALARNAGADHVRELHAILDEADASTGRPERLAELDYDFNRALARASANRFYILLMQSIRTIHLRIGTIIFTELGNDALILATERAIVRALEQKRLPKLKKSLAVYLDGGTGIVRAWIERQGSGDDKAR
jgi:DNA-binding FadR family transcriptional regulator